MFLRGRMVMAERDLLLSLLKLTGAGPVSIECIKKDAKTTSGILKKFLEKIQQEDMIYLKYGTVEADSYSRLKLAVRAVSVGADVEHVSHLLRWQEFEDISATALERNNYVVAKNVRFRHAGRKWEIDLVGCRKPLTICIDCKHWRHGTAPSALRRITDAQVERTLALTESLPNVSLEVECVKWERAIFVPAILTLVPASFKFYDKVPIVPVLQLQDFLNQLPAHTESLKHFVRVFNHLSHDF